MRDLAEEFGNIDIYLFDQLLKGRIAQGDRVLDAGCGSGRNAHYLLREGLDVHAVDENSRAIDACGELARELGRPLTPEHAQVAPLDSLPFAESTSRSSWPSWPHSAASSSIPSRPPSSTGNDP